MKTVSNFPIGENIYDNVPVEVLASIQRSLAPYLRADKAKAQPKAEKPAPKKEYAKVYAVAKDGKSVTVGNDGFIPTKVFKGVTYSLKLAGAKYNADTKAWMFGTKKACAEWCKAQDARA